MSWEWHGRFQAQGGGNLATGNFDHGTALFAGWAVGSTDGGHQSADWHDASWTLHEDGTINWNLLENFAYRSVAELIVIGKAIMEQYYGKKPHHTYWSGCSTGGRQGYTIAQRSPGLVDGILATAPAIGFVRLLTAGFWPQLLMRTRNIFMSNCELEFVRQKAIEHCDVLDKVCDGILEDPEQCDFDPWTLVGEVISCPSDTPVYFTQDMAQLVADFRQGPKLRLGSNVPSGLAYGIPWTTLANISTTDGVRSIAPHLASASWLQNVMLRNPNYTLTNLDETTWSTLFSQSMYEFGSLLNADNPDLSTLRDSGTKLMTWHGLDDEMIPVQNTIDYRKRVESIMGGPREVDKYYRLFLAPGVEHCVPDGKGPYPKDALKALVDWVERDIPPKILAAERPCDYSNPKQNHTIICRDPLQTRDLCLWPAKQVYVGGNPQHALSWACADSTPTNKTFETIKHAQPDSARLAVAELMAGNTMTL